MGQDGMGQDKTEWDGTGQGRMGRIVRDGNGWVGTGRWFRGADSMI